MVSKYRSLSSISLILTYGGFPTDRHVVLFSLSATMLPRGSLNYHTLFHFYLMGQLIPESKRFSLWLSYVLALRLPIFNCIGKPKSSFFSDIWAGVWTCGDANGVISHVAEHPVSPSRTIVADGLWSHHMTFCFHAFYPPFLADLSSFNVLFLCCMPRLLSLILSSCFSVYHVISTRYGSDGIGDDLTIIDGVVTG